MAMMVVVVVVVVVVVLAAVAAVTVTRTAPRQQATPPCRTLLKLRSHTCRRCLRRRLRNASEEVEVAPLHINAAL
jgi:hypothetical protein